MAPLSAAVVRAGEKKLAKLAAPDTWKDGSRNVPGGKDGGRMVGENKALTARSAQLSLKQLNSSSLNAVTLRFPQMGRRFQNAYASKCTVCKMTLHQQGIYCQTCAYSKGAPSKSSPPFSAQPLCRLTRRRGCTR